MAHQEGGVSEVTKERGARFAQLLLRAIDDPETRDLDEALAAAELAMQDDIVLALDPQNRYHGPVAPGPGWQQVGTGKKGGKIWQFKGQGQPQAQPQQPQQHQHQHQQQSPVDDKVLSAIASAFSDAGGAMDPERASQLNPDDIRQSAQVMAGREISAAEFAAGAKQLKSEGYQLPESWWQQQRQQVQQPTAPPSKDTFSTADIADIVFNSPNNQIPKDVDPQEIRQKLIDHFGISGTYKKKAVPTNSIKEMFDAGKIRFVKPPDQKEVDRKVQSGNLNDVLLVPYEGNFVVLDGSHSLLAAIKSGRQQLNVIVPEKPIRMALSYTSILARLKAESPLSAYFAHDIFDKRAQGILNRTMTVAKELSTTAKRELKDALKSADPSEMGHRVVTFVNKYRLQLADLLGTTQLAALLAGASEVAERLPPLPQAGSAPPPPPTLPPDEAQSLLSRLRAMPQAERDKAIYDLPPAEQHYVQQSLGASESIPPTTPFTPQAPPSGSPERVHYPIIEEAARELARKNVVTRPVFDKLDDAARQKAFTVAGVDAQETLTKIRDALAENVAEGADVEAFREKVMEQVAPGTFLSEGHLETVARTNIQKAFSDGQETVLSHSFVRSGFPYRARDAIHDDRVRENHLALEKLGIQGTNIYRADDPVWKMFRVPWDYNDRCADTPVTIRQAAEKGIAEAQEWLRTGVEPSPPAFVPMPNFAPPPGFQRALESAPLSIRLSATLPTVEGELHEDTATIDMAGTGGGLPATPGDFAVEGKHTKGKSKGRRGRRKRVTRAKRKWRSEEVLLAIAAGFALDSQYRYHGPQSPGPGWAQVGVGPQGGKIWQFKGQGGQAKPGLFQRAKQLFVSNKPAPPSKPPQTTQQLPQSTQQAVKQATTTELPPQQQQQPKQQPKPSQPQQQPAQPAPQQPQGETASATTTKELLSRIQSSQAYQSRVKEIETAKEPVWQGLAKQHNMPVEKLKQQTQQKMQAMVDDLDMYVRVPAIVMPKILESGRFKSQHETTEAMGTYSPKMRRIVEDYGMALPQDAPAQVRPISGYMGAKDFGTDPWNEVAHRYGSVIVKVKPHVRDRSTVTFGDSASVISQREAVATPVGAVGYTSVEASGLAYRGIDMVDNFDQYTKKTGTYIETQMFDGLTMEDVEEISFDENESPFDEQSLASLKQSGVKVRSYNRLKKHPIDPNAPKGWGSVAG